MVIMNKTENQAIIKDNVPAISLAMPIKGKLYKHQQDAFDFVRLKLGLTDGEQKSNGVALFMEMGTGKTLVGIATAGSLYLYDKISRVLIVAPISVLSVWKDEFKRFANFRYAITVLNANGTKGKKNQLDKLTSSAKSNTDLQIVAVNYESAYKLEEELKQYGADLIIADEGHKIKNGCTKRSKTLHILGDKAKYKLLLTGTPITNKEMDVFSQYRFTDSHVFGNNFFQFRDKYFYAGGYQGYEYFFREDKENEFSDKLHSIAFRATKKECVDLPAITEEERFVDLEPGAMKHYRTIESQGFVQLKESKITIDNVLTQILRLSQISGGYLSNNQGVPPQKVSNAKLDALSDILDTAVEENKKIVVMAKFRAELDGILELLDKKCIGYAAVHGDTKDRAGEIARFQNDSTCRVFVGQIQTAGLGITLTAASTMVFYSLDYNMADFDQAKARIHRVGQTEKCHYIYLLARDTVDEKVLDALKKKINLAKMLIDEYRGGKNPLAA